LQPKHLSEEPSFTTFILSSSDVFTDQWRLGVPLWIKSYPKEYTPFDETALGDGAVFTPQSSESAVLVTNPDLDPLTFFFSSATINVPRHWQLQGLGRPQYTTVIYPLPVIPPTGTDGKSKE